MLGPSLSTASRGRMRGTRARAAVPLTHEGEYDRLSSGQHQFIPRVLAKQIAFDNVRLGRIMAVSA